MQAMGTARKEKEDWMAQLLAANDEYSMILDQKESFTKLFSTDNFRDVMKPILQSSLQRMGTTSAADSPNYKRNGVRRIAPLPNRPSPNTSSFGSATGSKLSGAFSSGSQRPLAGHPLDPAARKLPMVMAPIRTRAMAPAKKELVVVTGHVDYEKLLGEQRALKSQTEYSDQKYRAMMQQFDEMQQTVEQNFNNLLQPGMKMISGLPEFLTRNPGEDSLPPID
eukprot:TRINITY_DN3775_c0_g1_i1.p1 TRINITY_DN3775_c0_g1~~TRINITY_DN3775_c0_g1_i1.p1  ORF type:complete len:223 (-),score=34.02 TRINITY_DN3775_c0_g1_i1:348-1016(-)